MGDKSRLKAVSKILGIPTKCVEKYERSCWGTLHPDGDRVSLTVTTGDMFTVGGYQTESRQAPSGAQIMERLGEKVPPGASTKHGQKKRQTIAVGNHASPLGKRRITGRQSQRERSRG